MLQVKNKKSSPAARSAASIRTYAHRVRAPKPTPTAQKQRQGLHTLSSSRQKYHLGMVGTYPR